MRSEPQKHLLHCTPVFEKDLSDSQIKVEIFCHKHGTAIAEWTGGADAFDMRDFTSRPNVITAWQNRSCQ